MKGGLLLLAMLCLPPVGSANHNWSGIDLCRVYSDRLPPGLTLEKLPQHHSPGAQLLQRFCTQCHNLPGPDRHTADEWRRVTKRMFMLLDVAHRFGGFRGRPERPNKEQRRALSAYLQQHAAKSFRPDRPIDTDRNQASARGTVSALLPILLLTSLGALRLWMSHRTGQADD